MKKFGRDFLNATNGGLEIFKFYLKNDFEVGQYVYNENQRFMVVWNGNYENYALYVDEFRNNQWFNTHRLNAIWYIKELFGIPEDEVYLKVNTDLNLSLIEIKPEHVKVEPKFINL